MHKNKIGYPLEDIELCAPAEDITNANKITTIIFK